MLQQKTRKLGKIMNKESEGTDDTKIQQIFTSITNIDIEVHTYRRRDNQESASTAPRLRDLGLESSCSLCSEFVDPSFQSPLARTAEERCVASRRELEGWRETSARTDPLE